MWLEARNNFQHSLTYLPGWTQSVWQPKTVFILFSARVCSYSWKETQCSYSYILKTELYFAPCIAHTASSGSICSKLQTFLYLTPRRLSISYLKVVSGEKIHVSSHSNQYLINSIIESIWSLLLTSVKHN